MKFSVCDNAYGREVERVLHKFADTIGELQEHPNYKVLRRLANAVDGAASRLGLPHDEAPVTWRPGQVSTSTNS